MTLSMRLHLEEAAISSGVKPDLILHYVTKAWIIPVDLENRIFDGEDIARIRLIDELQHEMDVNDEAIPVIMHLIDQINRLHIEFRKS